MIDAVLSYHMNPLTCGVCKFNVQLAKRLGVRHGSIDDLTPAHSLISIKTSEIEDGWYHHLPLWASFDLLLHDRPGITEPFSRAKRVFYADELGCPSTIAGNPTRGALNILTFGMAHKFQAVWFERLRHLLDCTPSSYTISLSTAIHEGTSWDETFRDNVELMRTIFDDHLRVLGFLGDDALARELREVQACALFYDPGARANNTSLWAAAEAGCPIVTNLDAGSPPELQHGVSVFDLHQLTDWPDAAACRVVRAGATRAATAYSWDRLIDTLTIPVHV